MTYAASEDALEEARHHPRHVLIRADIADAAAMRAGVRHAPARRGDASRGRKPCRPLDRRPGRFVQTNVVGTFTLLEAARALLARPDPRAARGVPLPSRLHRRGVRRARRTTIRRSPRPRPTIRAARIPRARRRPTIWCAPGTTPTGCRPSSATPCNNYGPWQFPEKLIPLVHAQRAGRQAAAGLRRRLQPARLAVRRGPRRGAGARARARPARRHLRDRRPPAAQQSRGGAARSAPHSTAALPDPAGPRERLIRFVTDRPGPRFPLRDRPVAAPRRRWTGARRTISRRGLARTIDWYLANRAWWRGASAPRRYAGQRLGHGTPGDAA